MQGDLKGKMIAITQEERVYCCRLVTEFKKKYPENYSLRVEVAGNEHAMI
jgi:hypothetical protein